MDTLFAALRRAVPKPAPREARRNAWISAETWRLVDERVATRRDPRYCQADRRNLGRKIGRSLARDRKRRTEEAGAAAEDLMKVKPPLTQEAWHRLQGWYKATVDRPPPPSRATLKRVTAERTTLYSRVPPPGDTILVPIKPFAVEEGVPLEADVEWAVKRLRNNRARGLSRMRAEDLTRRQLTAPHHPLELRSSGYRRSGQHCTAGYPPRETPSWSQLNLLCF